MLLYAKVNKTKKTSLFDIFYILMYMKNFVFNLPFFCPKTAESFFQNDTFRAWFFSIFIGTL